METIGVIIACWLLGAAIFCGLAFWCTTPPLDAKDEMILVGSMGIRAAFWAYLFAPYGVAAPFVGIIAPASLFIPAYIADSDPNRYSHIKSCLHSLAITWGVFMVIYISRQIMKRKWP
tara:strand:- start:9 stop:362 length:354 start_codon:yes stop_codon:yes gene_type:complete